MFILKNIFFESIWIGNFILPIKPTEASRPTFATE